MNRPNNCGADFDYFLFVKNLRFISLVRALHQSVLALHGSVRALHGSVRALHATPLIIFFIISSVCHAQQRITIDDPDLSFSYILPEGYTYADDPYYHYVFPKTGSKDQLPRLALTYYDGYCNDLNDCFDGKLNGELRSENADFSIIEKKSVVVSNTAARLAAYSFTQDGVKLEGILCTFIKYNAFFVVNAEFPSADSAKYTPVFQEIIESIKVQKP